MATTRKKARDTQGANSTIDSVESATKKMRVSDLPAGNGHAVKSEEADVKPAKESILSKFMYSADIELEDQESIVEKIQATVRSKVVDRRLSWAKQLLAKDYPDFTPENIEGALMYIFSKKKEYEGQDLRQLVSSLTSPTMIQNQELTYYLSVGNEEVTEHLSHSGEFYFLVCNKHGYNCARKAGILTLEFLKKTPIILLQGLRDIFTQDPSALKQPLIGFKKVPSNPFQELIEHIQGKVTAEYVEKIEGQFNHLEEKKQIREKNTNLTQLVSLFTHEDGVAILETIENFFREKVTDRRLAWAKAGILEKNPDETPEHIGLSLAITFSKKREYAGKDLTELIARQNEPTLIQIREAANYFSVGTKAISEYVSSGGEYHFILCNKHGQQYARKSNILSRMLLSKVPVLMIRNLRNIFTANLSEIPETLVGFKNLPKNPFQDLIKSVIEKIPNTYLKELSKYADESTDDCESMEIEVIEPKLKPIAPLNKSGAMEFEDQQAILSAIKAFMENKVTDHKLSWAKANLVKKHTDWTEEEVTKRLTLLCNKRSNSGESPARDLTHLLSTLSDPKRIQSSELPKYFVVGKENIKEHLEKSTVSSDFHFILCSKNGYGCARKQNILSQARAASIPVILINGLSNFFAFDQSAPCELIVAFKKDDYNPFQELVELVEKKIQVKLLKEE